MLRWGGRKASNAIPAWTSALQVLDHCSELGAGCLQIGVSGWNKAFAKGVRERSETLGIVLEGQIGLPRSEQDVAAFEGSVKAAKEAGVLILRVVCQGGRRYELYRDLDAWKTFLRSTWTSLILAEPVAKRHGVMLAIENHKDWRVAEFVELLRRLGSESIGVTLDFGNNIALLEDPIEVVKSLAPFTVTTHIKDMGVEICEDGFLLSEVPLGDGVLDLKTMISLCEEANPAVQFNLEMITRDPLKVPTLTDEYWVTFQKMPAKDLAATMRLVHPSGPCEPLPRIADKTPEEQLAYEEANNRACFRYARDSLGFA